jgi:hypothetical protein
MGRARHSVRAALRESEPAGGGLPAVAIRPAKGRLLQLNRKSSGESIREDAELRLWQRCRGEASPSPVVAMHR